MVLKDMWIVAVFMFLVTVYFFNSMKHGLRFARLELYVILLILCVPVVSAFMAKHEFGQPLVYGILARRNITLTASVLIFLHYFRRGSFSLNDVDRALVGLAWFSLTLYTVISLVFDPSRFAGYGEGFVSGGHVTETQFKFDTIFIIFGFIYYAFLGYLKKDWRQYLFAFPFLLFLVFIGKRSLLVAMVASYVYFIWRWGSFQRIILWVPKALIISVVLLSMLFLVKPDYMAKLGEKFNDAITVLVTGEESADASANARIFETRLAWPYIEKHWLMGNGDLSKQWRLADVVFKGRFYPSDIGIIGVLYLYGVFGLILFSIQFLFAWRYAGWIPRSGGGNFALVNAVKGLLLYYAIHSIATGRFANSAEIGLLLVAILYVATLQPKDGLNAAR